MKTRKKTILTQILSTLTLLTTLITPTQSTKTKEFTPVLITEIFRHGARAPLKNMLKFPEFKPYPFATLTPNGQRQHFSLGKKLQSKYYSLFSKGFNPLDQIKMFSSNAERCAISALSKLTGLVTYGQNGQRVTVDTYDILNPPYAGLNVSQPVGQYSIPPGYYPVHFLMKNESKDEIFMEDLKKVCKVAQNETEIYLSRVKDFEKYQKDLLVALNGELDDAGFGAMEVLGTKEYSFLEMVNVWDELLCFINLEGKYPKKVTGKLMDRLTLLGSTSGTMFFEGIFNKLHTTKLAEEILKWMDLRIQSEKLTGQQKYIGFSGHDSNIYPFLIGLGLASTECLVKLLKDEIPTEPCYSTPPFATSLIFELNYREPKPTDQKQIGEQYFIKVLYNGESMGFCPESLTIGDYCPYNAFKQQVKDLYIEPLFDRECLGILIEYKTWAYGIVTFLMTLAILILTRITVKVNKNPVNVRELKNLVNSFSDWSPDKKKRFQFDDSIVDEVDEEYLESQDGRGASGSDLNQPVQFSSQFDKPKGIMFGNANLKYSSDLYSGKNDLKRLFLGSGDDDEEEEEKMPMRDILEKEKKHKSDFVEKKGFKRMDTQ
jgi:hypothetical protein